MPTTPCNASIIGVGNQPDTPITCHGEAGHPGPHQHTVLGQWTDDTNGAEPHRDTTKEN
ncbi:hypothetical protein [Streptomyces sp. NRRL F-5123]|uniref:hypothetical protein n=1 Tax=Streptomyces sp. NRRL F-5123 TaxID=1463856 RepID=UPI000A7100AC|nr:hypothetical protein [Streptomyces sp. NRRL F-5123]